MSCWVSCGRAVICRRQQRTRTKSFPTTAGLRRHLPRRHQYNCNQPNHVDRLPSVVGRFSSVGSFFGLYTSHVRPLQHACGHCRPVPCASKQDSLVTVTHAYLSWRSQRKNQQHYCRHHWTRQMWKRMTTTQSCRCCGCPCRRRSGDDVPRHRGRCCPGLHIVWHSKVRAKRRQVRLSAASKRLLQTVAAPINTHT